MNRENYLVGYLKKANEKPDNDHLLSYGMAGQMRGFRNKQIAENEKVARLKHFEKNLLGIDDIYHFLINCSCINQNDLEIIMNGIVRHSHKDYLSSISVLTPKIESAIYEYLRYIGADVTSYDAQILAHRMLGGLIDQPEIEKNFGIDFKYFIKLFLIADDSINFRNRFSHGAVNIQEFNETASFIIIFILLKIYSKSFKISG